MRWFYRNEFDDHIKINRICLYYAAPMIVSHSVSQNRNGLCFGKEINKTEISTSGARNNVYESEPQTIYEAGSLPNLKK